MKAFDQPVCNQMQKVDVREYRQLPAKRGDKTTNRTSALCLYHCSHPSSQSIRDNFLWGNKVSLMARILGLLTPLIVGFTASAHGPTVVLPGQGDAVPVPFHETALLLSEADSPAGVSIYEFVVSPKSGGAPPHRHTHEDEYAYILEGTLTLMVGEETVEAVPGTLAALTRGTVHAFWNATDQPVRTLFFISQGGFERFFDAVAVSLRDQPPANAQDANARVGAIAAKHGIEILPELIPAEARDLYAPK